jgi:ribonuclease HI
MSNRADIDATVVFTDGACSGNPGPGGWGWAVAPTGEPQGSGGEASTTNQRMELTAVLEALRSLGVGAEAGPVVVVSDSTYVVNCFRDRWHVKWRANGWRNSKKEPVANADLWRPLIELAEPAMAAGRLEFRWVKGHSGDPMNDLVDRLAVAATPR